MLPRPIEKFITRTQKYKESFATKRRDDAANGEWDEYGCGCASWCALGIIRGLGAFVGRKVVKAFCLFVAVCSVVGGCLACEVDLL